MQFKDKQSRTLAYQLATPVDTEKLKEVTGGADGNVRGHGGPSLHITGGTGRGVDCEVDTRF